VGVGTGPGILHREPPLRDPYLESGVIEIERLSSFESSLDALVDATVHANEPDTPGTHG
jgi:hypothetical protein